MKISDLSMSQRAHNILARLGIETVEELVCFDWGKLCKERNCGTKTMTELLGAIMDIVRGDVLTREVEWRKQFGRHDKMEAEMPALIEKARKYDQITKIVKG